MTTMTDAQPEPARPRCWPALPSRSPAAAQAADPIWSKAARQGRRVHHRLLPSQQRRALSPARQRRADRRGEDGAAVHAADRRWRGQREHPDQPGRQFHHPEGRSAADLAVRGGADHPGGQAGDGRRHPGDRARPQDGRRCRARTTRPSSAATTTRSPRRRANIPPRRCCPMAARSRCFRACRARPRRSSG